jgi:hypothetical protein
MTIYVTDDQTKATLIFRRVPNDFGICCTTGNHAVNEKWQVSYRHPLRTGNNEIVLGYTASYRFRKGSSSSIGLLMVIFQRTPKGG